MPHSDRIVNMQDIDRARFQRVRDLEASLTAELGIDATRRLADCPKALMDMWTELMLLVPDANRDDATLIANAIHAFTVRQEAIAVAAACADARTAAVDACMVAEAFGSDVVN